MTQESPGPTGSDLERTALTPSTPPLVGGDQVLYIAVTPAGAAESLLNIEGPYQGGGCAMPIC